MLNRVILMGRITQDLDLRQTPNGTPVLTFNVAVDRGYAKQGEDRQTDFITCVAWQKTAEFISRYFGKGRMIAIEGNLRTRTYDDKNGSKHYVTEVYVDNAIKWYISSIVVASRRAGQIQGLEVGRYVRIGASPRASIAFLKMAKATALIQGRTYVTPEDVKQVSHQVLRHRIGLNYSAVADNVPVEAVIDALVNSVKAP